jgi:hypothetical protein
VYVILCMLSLSETARMYALSLSLSLSLSLIFSLLFFTLCKYYYILKSHFLCKIVDLGLAVKVLQWRWPNQWCELTYDRVIYYVQFTSGLLDRRVLIE